MEHEVAYSTELTKIYHTNYVRNSRAIAVLWGIFTVIYAILNVVVFIQPQWFGDTGLSPVPGFFGLWRVCEDVTYGSEFVCQGDFLEFTSILTPSFQVDIYSSLVKVTTKYKHTSVLVLLFIMTN